MVCVCGGTAAPPQGRQVEALFPAARGGPSRCLVLGTPLPQQRLSGGTPESFLLALLRQSN